MTEEQYYQVVRACDRLLRHPQATLEWVAIPWLHVLSEHPVYLSRYRGLDGHVTSQGWCEGTRSTLGRTFSWGYMSVYRAGWLAKNFGRAIREGTQKTERWNERGNPPEAGPRAQTVDVVIVSHLVNLDHLPLTDDFYFGGMQRLLAERGLSSLLLLQNQTRWRTSELFDRARRDGPCSRELLPDVATVQEELSFLKRCLVTRRQLRRQALEVSSWFDKQVARRASDSAVSGEVLSNLRLHAQIRKICRRFQPSIVITLYEGHAWERCVWHAARAGGTPVLCVGYQHTVFRRRSHALKRSLGHEGQYDPDAILTVGEFTRKALETSSNLEQVRIVTFGTHRRDRQRIHAEQPKVIPVFVVVPEGIESECEYLFTYALECARRLPGTRFILRSHPVLPFEKIESVVKACEDVPGNVDISRGTPIEEDFKRSGYVIYRGSSSVIYGILAGLKPFYVGRSNEMSIDPLDGLNHWREHVTSVDDLIERYAADQRSQMNRKVQEWKKAYEFCDAYVQPIRSGVLEDVIAMAKRMTHEAITT